MHRARLKATSDCRLLLHSFGSVSFVTGSGLPVDSFGALAFVTVELRASRVSPVVKEGASLQGRLGGFSASLQGRLDRFSAAGLQGWTAFQQLAFRPLGKQDDNTDAAKCGAKVCAERTHFFGQAVHESAVLRRRDCEQARADELHHEAFAADIKG